GTSAAASRTSLKSARPPSRPTTRVGARPRRLLGLLVMNYPPPVRSCGGNLMGEREQCWVINNEVVEPPPKLALSREQLTDLHHQFIHDLDEKGMLVGAGPFLDDTGNRFGTGMIIFRAATRAEAEKIANSEPYIAHGTRRLKLVPWQRIAGR